MQAAAHGTTVAAVRSGKTKSPCLWLVAVTTAVLGDVLSVWGHDGSEERHCGGMAPGPGEKASVVVKLAVRTTKGGKSLLHRDTTSHTLYGHGAPAGKHRRCASCRISGGEEGGGGREQQHEKKTGTASGDVSNAARGGSVIAGESFHPRKTHNMCKKRCICPPRSPAACAWEI